MAQARAVTSRFNIPRRWEASMNRMILAALTVLVMVPAARAQEAEPATEVYVAYYKISFADMPQWIADYHEFNAPILQELVDEGMIVGFGAHMHNTGGEYNIRQALRGTEETDFDDFWAAYLSRVAERHPEASARGAEMIQAHADEIWEIQELNVSGGGARYFYDAHFQLGFGDLEAWNEQWDAEVKPVLEQALANGEIAGWVEEGHNTGGRFNWKIITMFNDWDDIDEATSKLYEALPPDHAMWGMIRGHNDIIWETIAATQ